MLNSPLTVLLLVSVGLLVGACGTTTMLEQPANADTTARAVTETIPATTRVAVPATPQVVATSTSASEPQISIQPETVASADVWQRIADQLDLSRRLEQKSVQRKLAWYTKKQSYLDRVATRSRPYLYHIVEQVEQRGMPLELALLPIVESAYQPYAYSPSHASGIWQFIPGTGKIYGLKQNWWYDGRRDIVAATRAALDYLEKLHKEFNGDWLLALAAYNTGERNVARAVRRNKAAGKPADFFSLRLPRETRGYVPSLLAVAELVANPKQHKVRWLPIADEPYFVQVDPGQQIDLGIAAELAGLSMDDFYQLNPGYRRWATDPDGPHRLLLPKDRERAFWHNLVRLPEQTLVQRQRYEVRQGDTLGAIAARHNTSVAALRGMNKLRGSLIRPGYPLLIPVSAKPLQHYTMSEDNRQRRRLESAGDGKRFTYTVRRGDTLWDIGRQYGVSVAQLTRWNGISSKQALKPGQRLKLALGKSDRETSADAKTKDLADPFHYTVQRGDSLWKIARKFNVTVRQLLTWNNLRKSSIYPNQRLTVYQGLTRAVGI